MGPRDRKRRPARRVRMGCAAGKERIYHMGLIEMIRAKARADKKRIVLPEGEERRKIEAAAKIWAEGLADPVLLGDPESIAKTAKELGADISGIQCIDPENSPKAADYAALLAESQNLFDFEAAETQIVVMPASSTLIDECAKERHTELAYYKDGIGYDDGRIVYVLCAMLPTEMKFEYKFDMKTGDVVESEKEEWEAEDNAEYREILESHGFIQ